MAITFKKDKKSAGQTSGRSGNTGNAGNNGKSGKSGKSGLSLKNRKIRKIHGQLPSKRSINLVGAGIKPINPFIAVPAIILICVLAGLISKYTVVDRIAGMASASSQLSSVRSQLDAGNKKLASYGDIADEYSHYTYTEMSDEEVLRVDRTDVLKLIDTYMRNEAHIENFSINGNVLTIQITANTLEDINFIAKLVENDPMVDFCLVTVAATDGQSLTTQASAHTYYESVNGTSDFTASTGNSIVDSIVNGAASAAVSVVGEDTLQNISRNAASAISPVISDSTNAYSSYTEYGTNLKNVDTGSALDQMVTGQITVYMTRYEEPEASETSADAQEGGAGK